MTPGWLPDPATVRAAVERFARPTPLLEAWELSERLGVRVVCKAESLQETGSFKIRGAAARLAALTSEERARGVVACSSGNHGRAVAHVAGRMGVSATICVPRWVDPLKLEGIRQAGAEALLVGDTFDESETHALRLAEETGRVWVSAYDDPWVIAGQATVGFEILEELGEPPAAVLVPLSGGGLAGGVAWALHEMLGAEANTVGVSAARAAVMVKSLRAGGPVELPEQETLAGALAGGIGLANRHSFPLVRELVREHAEVGEEAIAVAMRYAASALRLILEGGGAVALAALLSGAWRPTSTTAGPVVVVLSGGNVAMKTLSRVLSEGA